MIPDFSGTLKNLAHVNIETVSSNEHGDMYGGTRPLDKREAAYMQASVEKIYDRFTSIVAEGRDMEVSYVDSIAQGRVWSGADALEIGLIDSIGTLKDAVVYAGMLAGQSDLSAWQIAEYPKPLTTLELLLDSFGSSSASVFADTPLEDVEKAFCGWNADHPGRRRFNGREEVHQHLSEALRRMVEEGTPPDVITFAGNGEPTLHPHFEEIVGDTIALRDALCPTARISVLSNATQLHREDVRRALLRVDNNILKLDSAFDATVRLINNPSGNYTVADTVEQMKRFEGRMILQTMFLAGEINGRKIDNTTEEEVSAWLQLVAEICPAKVMAYSLDRDTPCQTLRKIPREGLLQIAARVEALGIPCSVA